jgi:succinate dehydrogenase/fumarate reductase flavoprotein subunit
MQSWDREVDLLVFGAGCGGMTAALVGASEGLKVLLCEKTPQVGGTTATSGGTIWVPGSSQSKSSARPSDIESARQYLESEVGAFGGAHLRDAFLAAGGAALDYLEKNSEVKFRVNNPYPDYHPERPAGTLGGRALSPLEFDGRKLGADFSLVRPPVPEFMVLGGMMVARDEIDYLIRPWASLKAFTLTLRVGWNYLRQRLTQPRGTRLLLGNALVGRLLFSLRRKGADIAVNARLVELVKQGNAVQGAVVEIDDRKLRIRARRGVVLATGGCAASERWRRDVLNVPIPHTLAFAGDSGDGLDAGVAAGADIDREHNTPFFWMPASIMNWSGRRTATYPHIRDRAKPGLIAVNAAGRRFVNESNSYQDFVEAMFRSHEQVPTIPAYLICDRSFIRDYGVGVIHPVWQQLSYFLKAGYLTSASTLEELAAKVGIDPNGLAQSVAQHNRAAHTGVDEAFAKGSTAMNRHSGDPAIKPNPCLRPIATAPFFALPVYPAPIGSSFGLRTDVDGQVIDTKGTAIQGLYACGNDMSSIMRGCYPGPGITLGPAVVFAYRVAMHAAGKAVGNASMAA